MSTPSSRTRSTETNVIGSTLLGQRTHERPVTYAVARLWVRRRVSPVLLVLSTWFLIPTNVGAEEYLARKEALPFVVLSEFAQDDCHLLPTLALDDRTFSELLGIIGPKLLDNPSGWSVEARIGGRPFFCFDSIHANDVLQQFSSLDFDEGDSGIPRSEIDEYFAVGKTVNRLWFTHVASNGFPIVVVLTPDGFFNLGAAEAPKLQGAASRVGFIGEPFGAFDGQTDFEQHVDGLDIAGIDDNRLLLVFDVHSEAGEGAAEVELIWDPVLEQPELRLRSAHIGRIDGRFGFAGLNFMRGPTLHGLRDDASEGGIQSFHDGRTVFAQTPNGAVTRNLLVPPVTTSEVMREDILSDVPDGTRLLMDQPQNVTDYFSKSPGVPYEHRTDLLLTLLGATRSADIRRAQISVDLEDVNPEASETANVFLAAEITTALVEEFSYSLALDATDFEERFPVDRLGIVYVSDQSWSDNSLFFQPLDAGGGPIDVARPLTDATLTTPANPAVSADGRYVAFDASSGAGQRIHVLDLFRGSVRRLTVDPFGSSFDIRPSLSPDLSQFAFINNRRGSILGLYIDDVATGLGPGVGSQTRDNVNSQDWSPLRRELAIVSLATLRIWEPETGDIHDLIADSSLGNPRFSPNGDRLAYASDSGIYVIDRDGLNNTQVWTDGDHPAWVTESKLVFQRTLAGETDLYLADIPVNGLSPPVQLTPTDGVNASNPDVVRCCSKSFADQDFLGESLLLSAADAVTFGPNVVVGDGAEVILSAKTASVAGNVRIQQGAGLAVRIK
jgi:Tol biopolymer transport system component